VIVPGLVGTGSLSPDLGYATPPGNGRFRSFSNLSTTVARGGNEACPKDDTFARRCYPSR